MKPENSPKRGSATVDFGAEPVTPSEKTARVAGVFHTVAQRYDAMNDIMSVGLHRALKRIAVDSLALRAGQSVLDLAAGTGDMARLISPIAGTTGRVVLCDINASMLAIGRDRMLDAGLTNVVPTRADAESLPFPSATFDRVVIAFGLRNLTDKEQALSEMHRVLRAGGRLLVLEFSTPRSAWLRGTYRAFQGLWPLAGRVVVGDAAPYRYLVDSIETHPNQAALSLMMRDAGFADVRADDLLGGIAAMHSGTKPNDATHGGTAA